MQAFLEVGKITNNAQANCCFAVFIISKPTDLLPFKCCLYCCKPILLKHYLRVGLPVRCIDTYIYVPIESTQILLVLSQLEHAIFIASN